MYLLSCHLGKFFPEHLGDVAVNLNKDVATLKESSSNVYAVNPDFGLQGAKISLTYPFITELQVRAMIEAAVDIRKEDPNNLVHVNICISNCSSTEEVRLVTKNIFQIGQEILAENEFLGLPVFSVGVSIDTVKMALIIKDWIQHVAFITFNTTKLTELCLGVSMQDRHLYYGINHHYLLLIMIIIIIFIIIIIKGHTS
jgi:pyruvate,orthophosphate dikinase